MSFLVSKPERIRVSVFLLPLLFLFSKKQCVLADIVDFFFFQCDAQNHVEGRDVESQAGIAASTAKNRTCRRTLIGDTEYHMPTSSSGRKETRWLIS